MSIERLTAEEAVRNGAMLLDEKYPEWYRHIDLDTLDIDNTCLCICGQLADYEHELTWALFGVRVLGAPDYDGTSQEYEQWLNFIHSHGFTGALGTETQEWKVAIQDRLDFDALEAETAEKVEVLV